MAILLPHCCRIRDLTILTTMCVVHLEPFGRVIAAVSLLSVALGTRKTTPNGEGASVVATVARVSVAVPRGERLEAQNVLDEGFQRGCTCGDDANIEL